MNSFHIARTNSNTAIRFRDIKIDTSLEGGAASARMQVDKGMANPFYILPTAGFMPPVLWTKRSEQAIASTAAPAGFDDAVRALHELGERTGVTGISIKADPKFYGSLEFADQPGMFQSGGNVIKRIGRDNAFAIDAAARRVLELVEQF